MAEIVEEDINQSTSGSTSSEIDKYDDKKNLVEITLKTIGPSPPSRLLVPSRIKVHDLRKLISENNHLPIEKLRLILRGKVLHDSRDEDDIQIQLKNSDSLIVAVKPNPPAKHLRDGFDDDDDLKFQLPQSTSRWKRRLYFFLHDKLKLPGILLMALFSLSLKILGTGFSIIFFNLGRRQAGDLSAYSIFNEDFRELPGTLNADRLDRDIRAGQL